MTLRSIRAKGRDEFFASHGHMHLGAMAVCRAKAPPPVADFDAWLADNLVSSAHATVTGIKLRRAVIMARNGCTNKEIGNAVGMSAVSIGGWLHRLPAELAA